MSKYVTNEAMRTAMTLQKGYIDQGDSNNAEGIDSLKAGKNLLTGVLTGTNWKSSAEAVRNPTLHNIDLLNDGYFIIKEADDIYIVSPLVQVEKGKTYCFSFLMSGGGNFDVDVVGSQNTYSTHSSGGGKVKFSFTPQVTESVYIFVKTTSKKLSQPQLELGSGWSQFTASTEEIKKYHDMDTREREATLLERVTELEDRMEEVVQTQLITTPPATLNAQVGYYYCMGGSGVVVDTMTIQLPAIADENKTKNVQFFMTMGSAPEVTFVSAGTERILYQKDFALEAERSYEVNALWNGHAWVITVVEIIVPFFAKLSLNNGEVVELQGSGTLTNAMVTPYSSSVVSAEIGTLCTSIGYQAFSGCTGLTSITIPNSVTSIGNFAFSGCTGLTSIVVDSANTVFDSRDNCNAIIYTPTNGLIAGCKNTVIPNTVTSIGSESFWGCSGLTSITIPNSVTSIGYQAFSGCSGLTSITIPNSVTSIGNFAFSGCTGLTSITIPNSVTSIGYQAFSGCTGLTSITIPNSVTSIGYQAFSGCTGLTSITIPNSVTSIGSESFNGCTGLTSITIPNSVTSIGSESFSGCTGLTSITCNAITAPTIQGNTFQNVKTGGTLTVPSGSTGYDVWMGTGNYYLGKYSWTKVEQ